MTNVALGSVVIPAWNEAAVIGRTLATLYAGIDAKSIEVVVACNGCSDGTDEVVRATDLPVTLLVLPAVGKAGAIRAAETVCVGLPRIYLDADSELSGRAAHAMLHLLANGAVACRPPIEYATTPASWPVRMYYEVRVQLPTVSGDLCGAGVYGLSAEARSRFEEFPDVAADDLFAARVVDRHEIVIAEADPVVVHVPRTTADLVRTLGRVYRGNRELATVMPERASSTTSSTGKQLIMLARDPRRWPSVLVYVTLVLGGRARSRGRSTVWERDDSSRRHP